MEDIVDQLKSIVEKADSAECLVKLDTIKASIAHLEFMRGGVEILQRSVQRYKQENSLLIASRRTDRNDGLLSALKNHIPYKDESGVISFHLHDYGRILRLAEQGHE
jgi:hypothetical protein